MLCFNLFCGSRWQKLAFLPSCNCLQLFTFTLQHLQLLFFSCKSVKYFKLSYCVTLSGSGKFDLLEMYLFSLSQCFQILYFTIFNWTSTLSVTFFSPLEISEMLPVMFLCHVKRIKLIWPRGNKLLFQRFTFSVQFLPSITKSFEGFPALYVTKNDLFPP